MSKAGDFPRPYRRSPDQDRRGPARHPVVIVGGGPVGLALAIDLGQRGVPCVVVDGKAAFGEGSRGLCYAKRTLEILDRLGVGERAVAKGVTWQLGKVFHGTELLYQFNLLPEGGHKIPAFINLQQYYIEQYLYERCQELRPVDLRFQHKCVGIESFADHARVDLETPEGRYAIEADWLVACDGSRSKVRELMGLSFEGRVFEDRFLIADIKMPADYPAERWFWFDPPFNPGQSALLHKQPDDIWRIDLQLGWDADPVEERKPERVRPRLEAMLGKDRPFEFEWISVYTFQCRRLQKFVHGPRDLRRRRRAPGLAVRRPRLQQRRAGHRQSRLEACGGAGRPGAAGRCSPPTAWSARPPPTRTSSTRPARPTSSRPSPSASRTIRDAALSLAAEVPFARTLVNSGRLSTPADLRHAAVDAGHRAVRRHGPPRRAPAGRAPAPMPMAASLAARPARAAASRCSTAAPNCPASCPTACALLRIGPELADRDGPVPAALRCAARARPGWSGRTSICAHGSGGSITQPLKAAATERALGWELADDRQPWSPSPNLRDPDQLLRRVRHRPSGLSDEASELLNARLILILANHIGERSVLEEALELARASLAQSATRAGLS